jgi:hypothetical protein
VKNFFWEEADSESPPLETNGGITEHCSSMYKALDEVLGLSDGDDPDHPLSSGRSVGQSNRRRK